MIKNDENCKTCVWDINNRCKEFGTCYECPHLDEQCVCLTIREGDECPHYKSKDKTISIPKEIKNKIIAVDFDGTLCENKWPEIGKPNRELIEFLKFAKKTDSTKLILWTCRTGDRLFEAVNWCMSYGLIFDAVNKNLPEIIEQFGEDTRKINADLYIDDKACSIFCLPFKSERR